MSAGNKRGAFIVMEGLDRSGKSTQAARLLERLQRADARVKLLKFPDRTTGIGITIDSYLRSESELDDRAIHLLFSANRWELASSIEESLRAGSTVLCDRYAFSGIAFSAAKGLPYEWCRAPDISLPAPDVTIFLDITPEKAKQRGGYGEERYEKEEMQRMVREVFQRIGSETSREQRWVVVDAGQDIDLVTEDIWRIVEPLVSGVLGPVTRLWETGSNTSIIPS
ncbi:thymidylate kinase [Gloeophyllum trabeum ATCC 11539]|uniref:Thymidylate kinase n=1 Tax=Gloeophyllum trabeum (strain ATCC 11539 / FP-39264 / Madison 617) TaxID=670483 RepID=S7QBG2_GLOTA|nr:thymidylate kinase [Gloeophyllum trabeum ATCC 11539]EPQ56698.1 thymidylate kinase [Gloeophyllum trabeum ATCC 11539]